MFIEEFIFELRLFVIFFNCDLVDRLNFLFLGNFKFILFKCVFIVILLYILFNKILVLLFVVLYFIFLEFEFDMFILFSLDFIDNLFL